jgi:DNA recombination protein RmuC
MGVLILLMATLLVRGRRDGVTGSALGQVSEQFLMLADERFKRLADANSNELEGKKQLIDQHLEQMNKALEKVTTMVGSVEKERETKFAQLGTQLEHMTKETTALTASTATLREALASTKVRGQWGERMADDILQLMGLKEGFNYEKQAQVEGAGSRPDFGLFMPNNLRLNMDVKFPLDNYVRHLDATSDIERDGYRKAFLKDVRDRIKEVTTREYIDPEGGTVDSVLLFIPNESVYAFIHDQDPTLIEFGLKNHVICCSPITLFAVLAVIRQSVEVFALRKAEEEVVSLFGRFNQEWTKFRKGLEQLGNRIGSTQKAYDELNGRRRRALERPLLLLEDLRQRREIAIASNPELESPLFSLTEDDTMESVADMDDDAAMEKENRS